MRHEFLGLLYLIQFAFGLAALVVVLTSFVESWQEGTYAKIHLWFGSSTLDLRCLVGMFATMAMRVALMPVSHKRINFLILDHLSHSHVHEVVSLVHCFPASSEAPDTMTLPHELSASRGSHLHRWLRNDVVVSFGIDDLAIDFCSLGAIRIRYDVSISNILDIRVVDVWRCSMMLVRMRMVHVECRVLLLVLEELLLLLLLLLWTLELLTHVIRSWSKTERLLCSKSHRWRHLDVWWHHTSRLELLLWVESCCLRTKVRLKGC